MHGAGTSRKRCAAAPTAEPPSRSSPKESSSTLKGRKSVAPCPRGRRAFAAHCGTDHGGHTRASGGGRRQPCVLRSPGARGGAQARSEAGSEAAASATTATSSRPAAAGSSAFVGGHPSARPECGRDCGPGAATRDAAGRPATGGKARVAAGRPASSDACRSEAGRGSTQEVWADPLPAGGAPPARCAHRRRGRLASDGGRGRPRRARRACACALGLRRDPRTPRSVVLVRTGAPGAARAVRPRRPDVRGRAGSRLCLGPAGRITVGAAPEAGGEALGLLARASGRLRLLRRGLGRLVAGTPPSGAGDPPSGSS